MTRIDVQVVGTANVTNMVRGYGQVQAQLVAVNAQLEQMIALQNGVDPTGYRNMSRAAAQNDKVFRNALASTGMFEQQQLRINRATDDYVKKLKAQKMSFRELIRERATAARAYKEQLQMEQGMTVRQSANSNIRGRQAFDVQWGKAIGHDMDTAGKRLAFFNEQLKSGAHQMVNWGKNTQWAGRQLMVGFTMPILAAGAAAGVLAYQIDQEFTRIAKVYDTTANANSMAMKDQMAVEKELAAVREAGSQTAINAAKNYGAAGKDTLAVQAELAATGLKGVELQEATTQVMRISRLGELDYQDSLAATISLQTVFRQSTEQLADSFNYMNAVENATSLTTLDFAQAIPIASAPIKSFGGDVKELGVLLTAMKSRGVAAVQGANAIKAAMQRLSRPSKQVSEEFNAITGVDIKNLVDTSDSLTQIFQRIREATINLSDPEKRDVFAGLFGSYQVTRMMAMVEGVGDLEDATTQVGRAAKLAGQSTTDLANIADREMDRLNDSVSGKFKNALEEVKLQMQTLGVPFVELATTVLDGVSAIISKFNSLPGIMKKGIAIGVGLAALAGPLVMLAGLFANLFGNVLKGFTAITGLLVKMEILTTEQRAAQAAAKLAESGFVSERTSVIELTAALNAMTEAQMIANQTMAESHAASIARAEQRAFEAGGVPVGSFHGPSKDDFDRQKKMEESAGKEEKTRKKMGGAMAGTAASMGIMAVSSGVLMSTSEGTAHNIAQYALIGSMVLPAAYALAPVMKTVALATGELAFKMADAVSKSGALKGGLAGARVGASGLLTLINPITLGITAAALAAFGIYKWYRKGRDEAEAFLELQKTLNDSAEHYAGSIGAARREWENIAVVQADVRDATNRENALTYFKENDSGKKVSDAFGDANAAEREQIATQQYLDMITKFEMSAKEAKVAIAALYEVGGGESAWEALRLAESIRKEYGNIKNINWGEVMRETRDSMASALPETLIGVNEGDFKKLVEEEGAQMGEAFYMAFGSAKTPGEAFATMDAFEKAVLRSWDDAISYMQADPVLDKQWQIFSQENKIKNSKDLSQWFRAAGDDAASELNKAFGSRGSEMFEFLTNANTVEKTIIESYSQDFAGLGDQIQTLWELQTNWNVAAKMLSYKEAKEEVQGLADAIMIAYAGPGMALPDVFKGMDPEAAAEFEAAMEAFAMANNILVGATGPETYYNILNNVKNAANAAAGAVAGVGKAWEIGIEEARTMQHDAMAATQQDMADAMRDDFDEHMNASIDAQQAAFDRQNEALDNKWERKNDAAEAYWDNRIDRINAAIDAEQKAEEKRKAMFDAEMARISRMNEAMNRNIDFNAALNSGDFDAAAKIRNDANAKAGQTALERAAEAGTGKSATKVEGLENRLDTVEEARDKYMDNLKDQEDAERKHLEKVQTMNEKALRKDWEMRKKSLDDQLELFLAFVPKNEKQLKEHMTNVGLAYDGFGKEIMTKADAWAAVYGDRMKFHLRAAGLELQSDKMWKQLGKASVKEMLKGMGFKGGMSEFRHFISTGEMGGAADNPATETHHDGGFVGTQGSRYGVARTTRGLAPSERMVRAQKGEFIVNRRASSAHGDLLERLNSGNLYGHDVAGGPGSLAAALPAALLNTGIARGTTARMTKAYNAKMNTMYAHYGGQPGSRAYNLPGVMPWVAEAADYLGNKFNIASILGVGSRSRTSEHPLGRALDFMVSDDRGSALADEVIKLHEPLDAMYVIWRQRINSFDSRGWRAMEDRGSATENHMDHVHVSFDATGDTGDLPALDVAGGFTQGLGGKHRPTVGGSAGPLHPINATDIGVGKGTPVYSVSDGVVTGSYDIAGPLPTDDYHDASQGAYGSYGRVIKISHGAFDTLYAHLSQRFVKEGQEVLGGAKIGLSGSTGNSSGPHLHFEAHNASPFAFLKKGGTIKNDNTPAILHKNERVLSAPLTSKLDKTIDLMWQAHVKNKGKGYGKFNYPALGTGMVDSPYTGFDQFDPFNQDPAKANAGNTAFGVKTGTYNLYRKSSNLRTQADLKRLMAMSDVLSLTEFIGSKRGVGDFITKSGWGIHAGKGSDDAAVIWNKAKIDFVEGANRMLSDLGGSGANRDRSATYARLRDKASGREFWQIAAHTAGQAAGSAAVSRAQYGGINSLVKDLQASGLPIFLAGDFNTRTNAGMPNFGLHESKRRTGVQHVYSSIPGISTNLLAGLSSDHPALLSMLNIPSMAKGGRVRWNNTIANLHADEQVLTANNTKALDIGLANLANGAGSTYNVKVYGVPGMDEEALADKVVTKIERKQARKADAKPASRRA